MPAPKFLSWMYVAMLALVLGACGDSTEPESAQTLFEDGAVDVGTPVDMGETVDGSPDAEVDGAMDAALVDCTEDGCPTVGNGTNAYIDYTNSRRIP